MDAMATPPKFKFVFCDMDGTLLSSKTTLSPTNAKALNEATSRGVNIIIATGKTRPAAISLLKGVEGVVSDSGPGVFSQGLLVYGRDGREIFRKNLERDFCKKAFLYSVEKQIPLVAFCEDRCLSLFEHPLVDAFHMVYKEPKAEIIPSIEDLVETAEIQKLVFLHTAEGVASSVRPHWEVASKEYARVVQALPDMLEIVPTGTSKGRGVSLLLKDLGVEPADVMAIGDGENDVEMLKLAGLGVALSNGCKEAKAAADVIGLSNDDDGVASAIYSYALGSV